ncbi:hypothetical protein [Endothiovibrio diazotrophicus]
MSNQDMDSPGEADGGSGRMNEAVLRGSVWAFVGLFFGVLYSLFVVLAEVWRWPVEPHLVAGTLAATIGSLIYGSMRLAVVVAMVVSLLCVMLFVRAEGVLPLTTLLAVVVPAGALIGALYGASQRRSDCFGPGCSRVYRADAKGLAGLFSGAVASLALFALFALVGQPSAGVVVALLCAVTGYLYMTVLPFCLGRFTDLLPPTGDGALVGACAALLIALFFFVMVGGIDPQVVGEYAGAVGRIQESLLEAVVGGALGAGCGGFLLGLGKAEWKDY